jgi:hypothetical protein
VSTGCAEQAGPVPSLFRHLIGPDRTVTELLIAFRKTYVQEWCSKTERADQPTHEACSNAGSGSVLARRVVCRQLHGITCNTEQPDESGRTLPAAAPAQMTRAE